MASSKKNQPYEPEELEEFLVSIIHSWTKTLTMLGFTLVPLFFILDIFMMPEELLGRVATYRGVATLIVIGQYFLLRYTKPSRLSQLHGYVFAVVVGGMITLMTTDLGGFSSTYYAGLNLVMIAVTMTVPWKLAQSAINPLIIIGMYVVINLIVPQPEPIEINDVINNLYFLGGTAVISVAIQYVKQQLTIQEFSARCDLQAARDALWGEMEVAKQIQTSLLPKVHRLPGYKVAATMEPADEVGGDYYDIIETEAGETWLSIGDVSGHGVESGLIMMMTQTSIYTTVNRTAGHKPSKVLDVVNSVIKKNISRLGTDRYMTISTILLGQDGITFAGKHQDILIHRHRKGVTEYIPTTGTWIGIVDDLAGHLEDSSEEIEEGDIVLLFTDGITEATNSEGEMYGEDRLKQALSRYAGLDIDDIVANIIRDVFGFMEEQDDDITLLAIKRVADA